MTAFWLDAEGTKAKRAEFVPVSAEAIELLWWLVQRAKQRKVRNLITYPFKVGGGQRRYVGSYVVDGKRHLIREREFSTEWRPVKNPKRAWSTTLKKLGLEGQHVFHNTKASFVTAVDHVASEAVTQQLARHKDYRTTQRYLKVNDLVARAAVEAASIRAMAANAPGAESSPKVLTRVRNE